MGRRFTLSVLLLLLGPWLIAAEAGMKVVFGVVGSSVFLDPEYGADLSNSDIVWTFTANNKSPVTILDYIPNYHKVEPNEDFKSRLYFNASDGSLMLNNLKPSDQGIYTITVNAEWIRSKDFKLIEPLSEPLINITYMDTNIELICRVSVGKASSILWRKDDEVITNGQRYQLVQNNSKLIISKATKSACGKYTCTVENPVSKKNNSYYLSIYGFPPLYHYTLGLTIAALVFATLVWSGVLISCLHEDSKTISLQFQRNMLLFLQFAAMLSFIILFAAFMCWIQAEGPSKITLFMLVLLCILLILTISSSCSMVGCDSKRLNKILSTKLCRVTLDVVTPLGGIIVICASGILLPEIMKQAGKGCEPAANLQSSIIPAVVVPLVILFPVFAVYVTCYRKQRKKQTTRTPSACQSEEDLDQPLRPEEVQLQAASAEEGSTLRNSVDEEEPSQIQEVTIKEDAS